MEIKKLGDFLNDLNEDNDALEDILKVWVCISTSNILYIHFIF